MKTQAVTTDALRKLFAQAKRGASRRGIAFELTEDEFDELCLRAGGRCEVTGIPFSMAWEGQKKRPYAPSIDRVASSSPYRLENCRLVCVCVNLAMGEWGECVLNTMAAGLADKNIGPIAENLAARASEVLDSQLSAALDKLIDEKLAPLLKQLEGSASAVSKEHIPADGLRPEHAQKRKAKAERLIGQTELRKLMGDVSQMTIWRWRQSGLLPEPMVINRRNYYKSSDIGDLQQKVITGGTA